MPDGKITIGQRLVSAFSRWRQALQRAPPPGSDYTRVPGPGPPNPLPPLSHGYVHEPYSGAWQQNVWCRGPADPANFSAVFACVQIISTDVAKLPPIIYRRLPDGTAEPHPNHPAQAVLLNPNDMQTHVDFFQQLMASVLLAGPAYVYLERDARNVVSSMHLLNPYRTTPVLASDGSRFYEVNYGGTPIAYDEEEWAGDWRGGRAVIPSREIMFHRELSSITHPLMALSPLTAALTSAMTGALIQGHQQTFFENMSRSSGVLTAPHKISKETAERLRTDWEQNFKAGSLGRVAVLGEGLTWQPLSLNAVDAQLMDSLKWTVGDVARCYRVPDYMLGLGTGANTARSGELMINYYNQALSSRLQALEQRIAHAFDFSSDVFVEFDMSELMRPNFAERMAAFKNAQSSGVYSINELRKMEELGPVAGGDEPLVQVQYVPLSVLGQKQATVSPQAQAPPSPPPARSVPSLVRDAPEDDPSEALGAGLILDMIAARTRKQLRAKL